MSRKPGTATPAAAPAYTSSRKPCSSPAVACASRATSAAQSGATALVPPSTIDEPSTRTWYPVAGSALPATSGTPRPDPGTPTPPCQDGCGKVSLTPPSVASPPPFHTVSAVIAAPEDRSVVPPQPSTFGLAAGKST